ncbi:MAG TPA: hypothetical protein VMT46_17830 [Anaerolineaceae bacterium]|nr:hypothetical protein [Anaerolineaceae bacterium]
MTYDENRQRVILLGNNYLDGSISTWSWDGQDWTRLETYQYPPYTMTVGGKLVYLPDLQTVVLINNYRQKVCSVDGCTFFPEEMQIWALTYRYLTFIPIISK